MLRRGFLTSAILLAFVKQLRLHKSTHVAHQTTSIQPETPALQFDALSARVRSSRSGARCTRSRVAYELRLDFLLILLLYRCCSPAFAFLVSHFHSAGRQSLFAPSFQGLTREPVALGSTEDE